MNSFKTVIKNYWGWHQYWTLESPQRETSLINVISDLIHQMDVLVTHYNNFLHEVQPTFLAVQPWPNFLFYCSTTFLLYMVSSPLVPGWRHLLRSSNFWMMNAPALFPKGWVLIRNFLGAFTQSESKYITAPSLTPFILHPDLSCFAIK